ncbi:MAG: hypothetical protein HY666_01880 [Chloroflexi bacterium]|nr:hypothetical protein [Chloroflexota bacterium]
MAVEKGVGSIKQALRVLMRIPPDNSEDVYEDIKSLLRLRFGGLREASRKIRSASSKIP